MGSQVKRACSFLAAIAILALPAACKAQQKHTGSAGTKNGSQIAGPAIDPNPNTLNSNSGAPQPANVAVAPNLPSADPSAIPTPLVDEPVNYPVLDYFATGTMFHKNDEYGLTREINVSMDASIFTANVLSFRSSKGQVDDSIKTNIGKTLYYRISKDEFSALYKKAEVEKKPLPLTFALYTKRIAGSLGDTFDFATPIPFFILPKKASRYTSLDAGPFVATSQVTAVIKKVPKTFTVNLTFSKMASSVPDETLISVKVAIPEDDNAKDGDDKGALYGAFPIDASTIYKVDTKNEIITALTSSTFFNDDNNRQRMGLDYKICKSVQGTTVSSYTCRPIKN